VVVRKERLAEAASLRLSHDEVFQVGPLTGTSWWPDTPHMQTVTIREAKARLNALVEAAERGEQVVLMRGSRLVAAIVPVSSADLELAPHLTDPQAERLWRQLESERASGASLVFEAPEQAVAYLAAGRRKTARPAGTMSKGGHRTRRLR
jgi:prevent-host-death family protein